MKERIKQLRKALKLSQADFGKNLGVSATAIYHIEKGDSVLTEQNILLICSITWSENRKVNEQWLRTGVGNMFHDLSVDEYLDTLLNKTPAATTPEFQKRFLSVLSRLNEEQWEVLNQISEQMLNGIRQGKNELQIAEDAEDAYMNSINTNRHGNDSVNDSVNSK